MKIIVTLKLGERNASHFLEQISKSNKISDIFVVRDSEAEAINKVNYVLPDNVPFFLKPIKKIFLMIYLSHKERTEYLHSFLYHPHGFYGIIAGKISGIKTGLSLLAGPMELFSFYGRYSFLPYCNGYNYNIKASRFLLWLIDKYDFITVTGNYTKNFLIENGIDSNKIFILPHTVDDRFHPQLVEKEFDVIFIGRLARVKHIQTIIQAVALVQTKIPDIRTVIVGDGECKNELETLASSLSISEKNLSFAGFQSNVWDWYNKSKLSIVTSEREGFPYSIIESLKCGVPVISSNCGDVVDIVKDGYNGRIIQEYDDIQGFADAIVETLTTPEILETYTKNAVPSVAAVNQDEVVKVWDDIIERISISIRRK